MKKLEVWEDNESLRTKLKNVAMPSVEIHTLNIADGFKAKVLLQLPPNMDRSGKTKYPMLVDVYGGPDSYSVRTPFKGAYQLYKIEQFLDFFFKIPRSAIVILPTSVRK